jgi:hypothetical protein
MSDPHDQWTEEAWRAYVRAAFKSINNEYIPALERANSIAEVLRLEADAIKRVNEISANLRPEDAFAKPPPKGEQS